MPGRLATMLALALGACAGSSSGRVEYAAVTVHSSDLVPISNDVYVLADADEPVFYTDGHYWLNRDSRWYRSRSYNRDFVYVREPSARLRVVGEPTAYIRYRTSRQEARNTPAPTPRDSWRDDIRDRSDVPTNVPPHQQPPLQPTQPQQPPPAYPRPPQQEPPVPIDRDVAGQVRNDDRPERPIPPGQMKRAERDDQPRGDSPQDQKADERDEHEDAKHEKHDNKKDKKRD